MKRFASAACYVLGICGTLACSVAMFAVPLGIAGAGAAAASKARSMQSMSGMPTASSTTVSAPAWVTALDRVGPELLIGSVALVILALLVRRSLYGTIAAVTAGATLYYGMYGQSSMSIMWVATAAGFLLLLVSVLGLRRRAV